MRLGRWFFTAAFGLAACTSSTTEMAIVNDAADAMGGADRILAVNTLIVEGTGENGNLGQNASPDADLPIFTVSAYRRTFDLPNNRMRLEQTRTPAVNLANAAPQVQIQAVDGDAAFNVNPMTGAGTRVSKQVATDRRMEMYHHPVSMMRAALNEGARVTNARTEDPNDVVDIVTANGDVLVLYIDSTTKLPSKVVTRTYGTAPGQVLGDVVVETTFDDYVDVNGLQLPRRLTTKYDRFTIADIHVSASTVNGNAESIAAPDDVKAAAVPDVFAAPVVTVEVVAPGVWYLAGQTHHSVLVEFADYLALIEAPQNELRTSAVLAKVKELKPGKPLKYVINTHHHFDHSGGVRRVIAEEGVTLITHAANKNFYEEIARRPHTIMTDELSRNPRTPTIAGVTDKYLLQDATRTIEIYPITGSPHADTLLMIYFPAQRLLVEADVYTPPAEGAAPAAAYPFLANLLENVQKLNLRVDRLVPIHGRIVPWSTVLAAAAPAGSTE